MSNKALRYLLSVALLSSACVINANAATEQAAQVEALTQQIAKTVATELGVADESEGDADNLEKVVSRALHAGKTMDEIRATVSQTMKAVTGKPLSESATASVDGAASEGTSERTIPLTTVLLPNESLSSVAKRIYGPENDRRYLDIYELNKDVIKDINVIPEGTVLKLPE
ncbi:hypothetical protein EOL70_12225 [Leucothrix sargassi]|nr:hypothetical protein EOL70_12225 [Leucothrix sargassi]